MVSQFISPHKVGLLGDLKFSFPEGTHAVGRLDNMSEGLLILTTNKKITKLLFAGQVPHKRTYLVQVRKEISQENLLHLRSGVSITIAGGFKYITPPCEAVLVDNPENFIRNIGINDRIGPHSWILITLTEGKYHQVRKMVAAVKHRCRRLVRVAIEDLKLGTLEPGGVTEIEESTIFTLLNL